MLRSKGPSMPAHKMVEPAQSPARAERRVIVFFTGISQTSPIGTTQCPMPRKNRGLGKRLPRYRVPYKLCFPHSNNKAFEGKRQYYVNVFQMLGSQMLGASKCTKIEAPMDVCTVARRTRVYERSAFDAGEPACHSDPRAIGILCGHVIS